jgi:thiol-disulfide isomerase/thioredoxin
VKNLRNGAMLLGVALLALALGVLANYLREDPGNGNLSPDPDVRALLDARFPDLQGAQTSLGQWRGKVLVVNFWATWCAPCREEIPGFVGLQDEFGPQGVQFVGIAADEQVKVVQFVSEFKMNYPQLVANYAGLDLARRAGDRIEALPYTLVLDRDGKLVHRELGVLRADRLRTIFSKLL